MKSTRSKHMLSLLLRPLDKMKTASDPAEKSFEQLEFSEHNMDNRAVIAQSPLPQEAENIHQDMAEIWEDVFGPPHIPPDVTSDKTSLKSLRVVENSTDIKSIPLKSTDSEELIPLAIEVPSSFENSPEIGLGDLPSVSAPNVPTPIPSPLNSHADCHDSFCSIHENWTQSPSDTNTSSAPNNSSDDECSASTKKRAKKRVRLTSEWSDVKRKCLKNIELAYKTPINLPKDKYKDLISLVDSGIIPSQYADFFTSLPVSTNNVSIVNSDSEDD
ncbi:unnamed protein product [Parnassius apollo]|uniref:(apollo) hypothetical protein n=1 Tax=Parnassius apollo TaxID=110799 RepID=A0A8S3WBM7_PARAO|nr:unnamed protein product [Parnassius apollo]